jgi:hypothetical protein
MLNFRIIELLLSTRIDGAIIHEENNPDPAADRRFPYGRSEFRALLRSGAPQAVRGEFGCFHNCRQIARIGDGIGDAKWPPDCGG